MTAPLSAAPAAAQLGRVWRQAWKQSVVRESHYRAQAYATIVTGVAQIGVALIPVVLIFHYATTVNGWSAAQVYGVLGVYQIVQGLLNTFVAPNLSKMSQYVSHGDLDTLLLLPVSPQLMTTFRWMQPAELGTAVTGLILVIISAAAGGTASLAGCLIAGAWAGAGLVLLTCLWANLSYLAFWLQSATPIPDLMASLMAPGQYPVGFFPAPVHLVLLTLLPIGLATSLPVEALAGHGHGGWLAVAPLAVAAALLVTRAHWRLAVRHYASASS